MEKRKKFLVVGVVIAILAVGWFVWYKYFPLLRCSPEKEFVYVEIKKPPEIKIYKNEELGFEFSYPEDVPIAVEKDPYFLLYIDIGGGMDNPYSLMVEKTDAKSIELLNQYGLKNSFESEGQGVKEQHYIDLAGEKARVTTFNVNFYGSPGTRKNIFIQMIHEGKLYSMLIWENTGSNKNVYNISDTMLPSFKFLK